MSVRAKCYLILGFCFLIATPGIFVCAWVGMPGWALLVAGPTFWLSGATFVIAMIGDGKEGLGTKRSSS